MKLKLLLFLLLIGVGEVKSSSATVADFIADHSALGPNYRKLKRRERIKKIIVNISKVVGVACAGALVWLFFSKRQGAQQEAEYNNQRLRELNGVLDALRANAPAEGVKQEIERIEQRERERKVRVQLKEQAKRKREEIQEKIQEKIENIHIERMRSETIGTEEIEEIEEIGRDEIEKKEGDEDQSSDEDEVAISKGIAKAKEREESRQIAAAIFKGISTGKEAIESDEIIELEAIESDEIIELEAIESDEIIELEETDIIQRKIERLGEIKEREINEQEQAKIDELVRNMKIEKERQEGILETEKKIKIEEESKRKKFIEKEAIGRRSFGIKSRAIHLLFNMVAPIIQARNLKEKNEEEEIQARNLKEENEEEEIEYEINKKEHDEYQRLQEEIERRERIATIEIGKFRGGITQRYNERHRIKGIKTLREMKKNGELTDEQEEILQDIEEEREEIERRKKEERESYKRRKRDKEKKTEPIKRVQGLVQSITDITHAAQSGDDDETLKLP